MIEPGFSWGPMARGVYTALLWMTAFVAFLDSSFLYYYIPFLAFLGLGLRPLLEQTGVSDILNARSNVRHEKRWQNLREKRVFEVRRTQHAERHKRRRTRDSNLPKNW